MYIQFASTKGREDFALRLFEISIHKNRSVKEALANFRWILGIQAGFNVGMLQQFCSLLAPTLNCHLMENERDVITWKFTPNGQYTAKSAYLAQFHGLVRKPYIKICWKVWAPEKCRFFGWLLVQEKIPTCDILTKKEFQMISCVIFVTLPRNQPFTSVLNVPSLLMCGNGSRTGLTILCGIRALGRLHLWLSSAGV